MKRQAWQDLRLRFVISHSFVAGQLYSMLPVRESTGRERYSESLTNQHNGYMKQLLFYLILEYIKSKQCYGKETAFN